jgi:mannose-6-phosphate isomerase
MSAVRLAPSGAEKVWGRLDLPAPFDGWTENDQAVGEIIFCSPDGTDPALLVKFLFTSQRLSIQVHPDDDAALRAGRPRGKDEAWIVLDAAPEAVIGLGLTHPLSKDELRGAVENGAVEKLIDWRPVAAGDCFYSAAGTIHAIGPGLSLVEIQQNCDITYRVYDYGRPRDLHVEEAIAVAELQPAPPKAESVSLGDGRTHLVGGPAFQIERWTGPADGVLSPGPEGAWLIVIRGQVEIDSRPARAGEVWLLDGGSQLRLEGDVEMFVAYPGAEARLDIWHPGPA